MSESATLSAVTASTTGHWSRVGLPPYEELNRLFPKNRLLWEQ